MKIEQAKIKIPSIKLEKNYSNSEQPKSLNIFTENKRGEFYYLKLENLISYKKQARKSFAPSSIELLAKTIKEHGIQQPLTVIKSPTELGKFEIISGERRFLAAKSINLDKIPCIIIFDYRKAEEIALIENIQREDLHPIELGFAYKSLYKSGNYTTQAEIAEKLGVNRTQITEYLKFAELSSSISDSLLKLNIKDRAKLRKIVNLRNDLERKTYIENELTEKSINHFSSKRSVVRKSNVFSIFLQNGSLKIKSVDISNLNHKEKDELKNILEETLQNLSHQ